MDQFNEKSVRFNFRCSDCGMIVTSCFEEEKDISEVREGQLALECPCGGRCALLTD
jgi:hypothetical protein